MSSKIKHYTDEPLGEIKVIKDFLPSPDQLVIKEDTVKVTLSLTKESVEFFKEQAGIYHTQYQKMIKTLLDSYARNYNTNKNA